MILTIALGIVLAVLILIALPVVLTLIWAAVVTGLKAATLVFCEIWRDIANCFLRLFPIFKWIYATKTRTICFTLCEIAVVVWLALK